MINNLIIAAQKNRSLITQYRSLSQLKLSEIQPTRMWADAQRDGGPAECKWRPDPCESSVIPFLVPRRKAWLTPAAGLPCSNAANIGERKTWT